MTAAAGGRFSITQVAAPERDGIAWGAQRQVRQLVLAEILEADGPVSVIQIAARVTMTPERVRTHLRPLVNQGQVTELERGGRTLYVKPDPQETNMERPTTHQRILEELPVHGPEDDPGGLTILEIASRLETRPNTVSSALADLIADGTAGRTGLGKRGDPFRHFATPAAENEAPGSTEAADLPPTDSPGPTDREPQDEEDPEPADTTGGTVRVRFEPADPAPRGRSPLQPVADAIARGDVDLEEVQERLEGKQVEELERVARALAEELGLEVVIRRPSMTGDAAIDSSLDTVRDLLRARRAESMDLAADQLADHRDHQEAADKEGARLLELLGETQREVGILQAAEKLLERLGQEVAA